MTVHALNPESLAERMVAELNENPEARRLLLRALLTDEFLMLPAKVDRLMDLPAKVDSLMELPAKVEGLMHLPAKVDSLMDLPAKVEGLMHLPAKVDSLMDLPGRVERLEADVSDLKDGQTEIIARQTRMEDRQTETEARQTRMEGDIAEFKAGQAEFKAVQSRMQGQLGNLHGRDYEFRMVQNIHHIVRRALGMESAKVLKGGSADAGELSNKVTDAERRGAITREQGDILFLVDAVVSGMRESDRSPLHAVAEISVTIGEKDVKRARDRADILSKVMGEPAMGVVIGDGISEPDRRRAERAGVAVSLIRQQGA